MTTNHDRGLCPCHCHCGESCDHATCPCAECVRARGERCLAKANTVGALLGLPPQVGLGYECEHGVECYAGGKFPPGHACGQCPTNPNAVRYRPKYETG